MHNFATADLCDIHGDKLQIAMPVLRHYGARKRFAGRISTVKSYEDNSLVREATTEAGAGRVLVVDGGGSLNCAMLGDMLAERAMKNGWEGIVLSACIRDSVRISKLDIAVMALAINPRKSVKLGAGCRDIPVHFSDVIFVPDEWLYADEDGIVLSQETLL
ncbi:MAG: ribonuclease E activity regulator RraA [Candidatus Eutrophobiaceae bacterium]